MLDKLRKLARLALVHVAGAMAAATAPKPRAFDTTKPLAPDNYPAYWRTRRDRAALTSDGKRPPTCKKCGYVGGNARGCGRAHPTQTAATVEAPIVEATNQGGEVADAAAEQTPPSTSERTEVLEASKSAPVRSLDPSARPMTAIAPSIPTRYSAADIAAAKARKAERAAKLAELAARAANAPRARPRMVSTKPERWSASRIAEETARAEAAKKPGELPAPLYTFHSDGFPRGGSD